MAVMQTLESFVSTQWPSCRGTTLTSRVYPHSSLIIKSVLCLFDPRNASKQLTLQSIPYEVQQYALHQRDVTCPEAPRVSVLHREADVPSQAAPSDENREQAT